MKKTLKISGIASSLLLLFGAFFKTMHWPMAGVMIVLGAAFFSLLFLPLMIALKFRDEENKTDKWVFSFGFLLAIGAFLGFTFKIMHWPGSYALMMYSIALFVFVYVPLYYLTRFKRPDKKFNSTMNAILMMAAGGMLFGSINVRISSSLLESVRASYVFMNNNSKRLVKANDRILNQNKSNNALSFHNKSEKLYNQIEEIKDFLLAQANYSSLGETNNLEMFNTKAQGKHNHIKNHFENKNGEYSLEKLLVEVNNYNSFVEKIFPNQEDKMIAIDELQLDETILSILLFELSQIQLQVANNENNFLSSNSKI